MWLKNAGGHAPRNLRLVRVPAVPLNAKGHCNQYKRWRGALTLKAARHPQGSPFRVVVAVDDRPRNVIHRPPGQALLAQNVASCMFRVSTYLSELLARLSLTFSPTKVFFAFFVTGDDMVGSELSTLGHSGWCWLLSGSTE